MMKIETSDDPEKKLLPTRTRRSGLGSQVRAMDARLKLLTELVDGHHEIFARQGNAKSRLAGGQLAN